MLLKNALIYYLLDARATGTLIKDEEDQPEQNEETEEEA